MNRDRKVGVMFGAASGLARLAAIRWAEQGGIAVAIDINEKGLTSVAQSHPNVVSMRVDVRDFSAIRDAVMEVETSHGPIERVDNAAAVFPTCLAMEMEAARFAEVVQVNFCGMVNVSLACLPSMLARSRGVLINYCSIAGLIPYMHMSAYAASKAACVAFTEILHHENRHRGVDIVCLCPPSVDTPLLEQATSRPKVLAGAKLMAPAKVLDSLEIAIRKRRFWCLPSTQAKFLVRLRRFFPSVVWLMNHRIERI